MARTRIVLLFIFRRIEIKSRATCDLLLAYFSNMECYAWQPYNVYVYFHAGKPVSNNK